MKNKFVRFCLVYFSALQQNGELLTWQTVSKMYG